MADKSIYGGIMGFKQALRYVLDVLCYAYYVKDDNLVGDIGFDHLEKLYCKMFAVDTCPGRSQGREEYYSNGVRVTYAYIVSLRKKKVEGEASDTEA